MTLHFIGLGLNNEKDITIAGLEAIKHTDILYLETYTAQLNCSVKALEKQYKKKITLAPREFVEDGTTLLKHATTKNVSLLIVGDPLSATTHVDLFLRAKKMKIKTTVIHNASILTAVGIVGLQLYKYGKTTSIPFPEKSFQPETPYDVIKQNKSIGLHTLLLLDLKPELKKYITINKAIQYVLDIEKKRNELVFTPDTRCVGCARLGSKKYTIVSGTATELLSVNFGKPLHSLVVPGSLHFVEEEALEMWKRKL